MKNLKQTVPATTAKWLNTCLLFMVGVCMLFLSSCKDPDDDDDNDPIADVNSTSIVTPTSFGRTNKKLGCLNITGSSVTISVWDNETVDGDIVSVYVNGRRVINEVTMAGPSNKTTVNVDLEYAGFNDIKLFAHNSGTLGPNNTAAMTITDDAGTKSFSITSDLSTNGYFDLVVGGSGVSCSSAGGGTGTGGTGTGTGGTGTGTGGTGTGTGTGTATTGNVIFWTAVDQGCGPITVSIAGRSGSISQFYSSGAPACGASGSANFTLPPGTYTWSASCPTYNWGSSITVTAGDCFQMKLN